MMATITTSNRFGRLTSSTISSSKTFRIEQPIILEIGSTVLRVGFAGSSRPQHVINMGNAIFDNNDDYLEDKSMRRSDGTKEHNKRQSKTKTESEWYLILSPLIEQVFDRLMCKPRRVVCLYSNKRYSPVPFQKALQQHLWNRRCPAMVELDQLQCLPIAQSWSRGLVVQISREEAVCICHADGQLLSYTYQMVPSSGYKKWLQPQITNGKTEYVLPHSKDNMNYDDTFAMSSLVSAILACLLSCPRDLRLHVASNVVFCGDGVFLLPGLPRRIMKRVRDILQSNDVVDDDTRNDEGNATNINFSSVPIDVTSLRPLASSISLISCAPYRPDFICFVGASLWAAIWNKYSDEETPIPWNYYNTSK